MRRMLQLNRNAIFPPFNPITQLTQTRHTTSFFLQNLFCRPRLKMSLGITSTSIFAYFIFIDKQKCEEREIALYQKKLANFFIDPLDETLIQKKIHSTSNSIETCLFHALLDEYPHASPKKQLLMLAFFYEHYLYKTKGENIQTELKKLAPPKEFFQLKCLDHPQGGDICHSDFPDYFDKTLFDYVLTNKIEPGPELDHYVIINNWVAHRPVFSVSPCEEFHTRLAMHYLDELSARRNKATMETEIIEKKLRALITKDSAKEFRCNLDFEMIHPTFRDHPHYHAKSKFYNRVKQTAPWFITAVSEMSKTAEVMPVMPPTPKL